MINPQMGTDIKEYILFSQMNTDINIKGKE